jgi:heme exporter protein C
MEVAELRRSGQAGLRWAIAGLLLAAMALIFVIAPQERTMGNTQRIVYVHVSVAWFGLLAYVLLALAALAYLVSGQSRWDHWARASAEVGWLCSTLTLVTGSLWAHEAWNTWWTWDPRLTTSLILWTMYAGYFVIRGSIEDPKMRARMSAVLSIAGAVDVPMVVMATRWFRGVHPVTPEMEPAMRWVLLASVIAFSALFGLLLVCRRRQLGMFARLSTLEQRVAVIS